MKTWMLMLVAAVLGMAFAANCAQPPANDNNVPKYDKATEVKLSGTVEDVRDYHCPVSGTLGSHITLKMASGNIELHLAATKYTKNYEMVFAKGDNIQVVGSKVKLNGEDTILAREIVRGQDTFTFRDPDGKPLW